MTAVSIILALLLAPPASEPVDDCFDLTPEQFAKYGPANHLIEFDKIDQQLLSCAILHETNKYRLEKKLRKLGHIAELDRAALIHAKYLVERDGLTHEEKENPKLHDPLSRVRSTGLKPMLVAENIATTFGIEYKGGKIFPLRQWGREGLSYTEDGPAIPRHSYRSFAAALVAQWMHSEAHKENILLPDAQYLGCAVLEAKKTDDETRNEFHKCFCVQEFFSPIPKGMLPAIGSHDN